MPSPCRNHLKNATQYPGLVIRPTTKCQTTVEVKAATEAKQVANVAKKQAKIASVCCAAEFKCTAMAEEELLDATPQPKSNPKSSLLATSAKMVTGSITNIEMLDSALTENNDKPEDSAEDNLEKTPIPISKKKTVPNEAVQKTITKSASEVHPQ